MKTEYDTTRKKIKKSDESPSIPGFGRISDCSRKPCSIPNGIVLPNDDVH
jgi:hypothetical protein